MKLPSFLRRSPAPSEAWRAGAIRSEEAVAQARRRARRRLVGAIVLVAIGVITFPLVFETAPRPIPVDVAIDIPRRDGLPPLAMPPAPVAASAAVGGASAAEPSRAGSAVAPPAVPISPGPTVAASAPALPRAATETPAVVSRPGVAPPARPASAVPAPPPVAATAPAPRPAQAPAPSPAPTEAARARSLLEGQASAKAAPAATAATPSAAGPKFVLQVGAFADPAAVKEARDRAERVGLRTFTQPVTTDAGVRTRVRVGPFATREEALAAQARAEAAGLKSVVMPQ